MQYCLVIQTFSLVYRGSLSFFFHPFLIKFMSVDNLTWFKFSFWGFLAFRNVAWRLGHCSTKSSISPSLSALYLNQFAESIPHAFCIYVNSTIIPHLYSSHLQFFIPLPPLTVHGSYSITAHINILLSLCSN